MAEALSRSEVESLLSALNPAQTPMSRVPADHLPALGQPVSSSELARRVVGLFERFRHAMASATNEMLPEPARLKRHMPVRVPFSELKSRSQENQLLLLIESEQSGGDLLAILDRQFAIQFVSGMLGQEASPGKSATEPTRHKLSPLEQRLLVRWLKESLQGVIDAGLWDPIELELVDSDRDLDAYLAQSPWWCEIWELKCDSLRGRIELCGSWEFFSSLTEGENSTQQNEDPTEPERLESILDEEKLDQFGQRPSGEV